MRASAVLKSQGPENWSRGRLGLLAPSTARPLARGPRVLIGGPLPFGFGLDRRPSSLVVNTTTRHLVVAPSTVRPLARDPRVLIGWPLPLGFGLDGRLLLARRGPHGAAQRLGKKWRHFVCALLASLFCTSPRSVGVQSGGSAGSCSVCSAAARGGAAGPGSRIENHRCRLGWEGAARSGGQRRWIPLSSLRRGGVSGCRVFGWGRRSPRAVGTSSVGHSGGRCWPCRDMVGGPVVVIRLPWPRIRRWLRWGGALPRPRRRLWPPPKQPACPCGGRDGRLPSRPPTQPAQRPNWDALASSSGPLRCQSMRQVRFRSVRRSVGRSIGRVWSGFRPPVFVCSVWGRLRDWGSVIG